MTDFEIYLLQTFVDLLTHVLVIRFFKECNYKTYQTVNTHANEGSPQRYRLQSRIGH